LGLYNQPYLAAKHWQAQISYQYADTDQFFVGDQRNDAAGPFGEAPHRQVNIFSLDVMYGVSNRVSLDLTLPFSSGFVTYQQGTPASPGQPAVHSLYKYKTGGLGDITLQAEYWLNDPTKPSRVSGSVDLGIKMPTGRDAITGQFYSPTGDVTKTVDEGVQLGNGGWELLLRAQGTAQISSSVFAYGSGYYGLSLTENSDVQQPNGDIRGVPDTYSGRLGAAYVLPVLEGLVVSVGGRINGVTVKDIIGGGDLYWRRPGYEIFVEPGLTWTFGRNWASVSVPVRVYQNKLNSPLDISKNRVIGSDFVPYLVVASVARRF
jgi:hypothetical protein